MAIFLLLTLPAHSAGLQSVKLDLAGHSVFLEIADTDAEKSVGLSNRHELDEGAGMLFVYTRSEKACFWMRETFIPLDAAFVDLGGKIVKVATMEPESLDLHCSGRPIKWVIEMPAGWFEENSLEPGSDVGEQSLAKLRSISLAAGLQ